MKYKLFYLLASVVFALFASSLFCLVLAVHMATDYAIKESSETNSYWLMDKFMTFQATHSEYILDQQAVLFSLPISAGLCAVLTIVFYLLFGPVRRDDEKLVRIT